MIVCNCRESLIEEIQDDIKHYIVKILINEERSKTNLLNTDDFM